MTNLCYSINSSYLCTNFLGTKPRAYYEVVV